MVGIARRVTVHPVCLSEVLGYFERNTGHMLTYQEFVGIMQCQQMSHSPSRHNFSWVKS